MSRVLVTGDKGMVGSVVVQRLVEQDHEVVSFDLVDGHDIRDGEALTSAVVGCVAAIHLAAADVPQPADVIVDTNVAGTGAVIQACVAAGVPRLVIASSVDALGIFMGEAPPDFLPLDDTHPARPSTPYGASKRAMERLAERAARSSGLGVLCLRPPGVCDDATKQMIRDYRAERASYEWDPIWEYGAWIHVEDLARALVAACFCPAPPDGFACLLVAANDINSDHHTGRELATLVHPAVPWRGGPEFDQDPRRSLIDSQPAQELLGWRPTITWIEHGDRQLDL